jgi:type VI secretion system protein VasD
VLETKVVRYGLVGLLTILLAACGGAKHGQLKADLAAGEALNPDPSGRNSPVYFYVFQLKTGGPFESADFYSLYQSPETVLGGDLLARKEYLIRAKQRIPLNTKLDPETAYLGFLAAFRDLDHSVWRAGLPVRPGKTTKLQVQLEGINVSIDNGQ